MVDLLGWSAVARTGKVEIPSKVLGKLGNPAYIQWYERKGKIEVRPGLQERNRAEFNTELKHSELLISILKELNVRPRTFRKLQKKLQISSATLSKYLSECQRAGLATHKSRNAPYVITQKGRNFLDVVQTQEVDDFAIEFVKGGTSKGSIIFRVPTKFTEVFDKLYAPRPLESLRRIFEVAFEFWVNRHSSKRTIVRGKDFNQNYVWDLYMWEMPPAGYPEIRRFLKNRKMGGLLITLALDNLEFSLKTGLFRHIRNQGLQTVLKTLTEFMSNLSVQTDSKRNRQLVEQFFEKLTGKKMPLSL